MDVQHLTATKLPPFFKATGELEEKAIELETYPNPRSIAPSFSNDPVGEKAHESLMLDRMATQDQFDDLLEKTLKSIQDENVKQAEQRRNRDQELMALRNAVEKDVEEEVLRLTKSLPDNFFKESHIRSVRDRLYSIMGVV